MKRRFALGIALTVVALSGCASSRRTAHPIEGMWAITSAVLAGAPLPPAAFDNGTLHLDAGRYEFRNDRGDYAVLPGSPEALDIHGTDGPNAGKTILAIFLLKGDTLTIAYDLSGKTRPTRFESLSGTQQFLVDYRRS